MMIVKFLATLEFELPDDTSNAEAVAQRQLDAFREAVQPCAEHGITIARLYLQDLDGSRFNAFGVSTEVKNEPQS